MAMGSHVNGYLRKAAYLLNVEVVEVKADCRTGVDVDEMR